MYYMKKPIPHSQSPAQLIPENETYLLENKWIDAVVYVRKLLVYIMRAHTNTLEGTMTAHRGDYIIEGVHGEHWSVKKYIFEATYERCDE